MKIKEEQLTKIKSQQEQLNNLINQIGILEANKHGLLHEMAGVNQEVEKFKKELEEQYGAVNINLEDGTYTNIEVDKAEPALAE